MTYLFTSFFLFPRNVFIFILRCYRFLISPLYGQVCRYYPSCSAYSLEAFQFRGLIRGFFSTVLRLLKCHPWSRGGVNDVQHPKNFPFTISKHGFVLPENNRKITS